MKLRVLLGEWLRDTGRRLLTTRSVAHGLPVVCVNTRLDIDSGLVLARLDAALTLIAQYTPHYYRHLQRDLAGIRIERYPCRGAYDSGTHTCVIELTFLGNVAIEPAQVAATILHEAMHARLHRLGFPLAMADRARQERFCRRAELVFGELVPGGEPVIRRALEVIQQSDDDIAPAIDRALAARRVAQADLDASPMPPWLRRIVARRTGLNA